MISQKNYDIAKKVSGESLKQNTLKIKNKTWEKPWICEKAKIIKTEKRHVTYLASNFLIRQMK